jgi:hypothetical protein
MVKKVTKDIRKMLFSMPPQKMLNINFMEIAPVIIIKAFWVYKSTINSQAIIPILL